jgi:hypothetical protein
MGSLCRQFDIVDIILRDLFFLALEALLSEHYHPIKKRAAAKAHLY